jgi:hypothetical protein
LAVLGLGGFRGRGNRNIWNGPSFWERRARNQKSMILKRKQPERYKANDDKRKIRRIKESKTNRRQRVLGVEIASGQVWNFIFFREDGQSPHSLVEILLFKEIIKNLRRIAQARKRPKLRGTVLKRLNSMLKEKHHELSSG